MTLAGAAGVAGCSSEDRSLGLHAVTAQILHQEGSSQYDYPEDIGVRVTVENTSPDRKSGTLVTRLDRLDRSGDGTPTVVNSWNQRRQVSLAGGTTRSFLFVFEAVFDAGDDEEAFRAEANI